MSYMSRLYGIAKHPIAHEVIETAEVMGAGYGLGYLQGRYRERSMVMGVPVDLLAGVAGKGLAIAATAFGGSKGAKLAPHLNNIGVAGLVSYAHTHGVGAGSKKAGVKRLLVQEKDMDKVRKVLPDATVLGAIPQAPHGDMLSSRDLESLAR